MTCVDAKTGKVQYEERIHNGRYRASPIYVDGKILCVSRDGVATVVQPGREFKVISENRMDDDITASPVVSDERLYLRGWKSLYAIGGKAD